MTSSKAEIIPVNLIRVMPAQGRRSDFPFFNSISLHFLATITCSPEHLYELASPLKQKK
jgi:hypothetical protein